VNGLPKLLAEHGGSNRTELDLLVEADNPWFRGHFPGQPILPGVVQIGWAVHYANRLLGFKREVLQIEQVKFKRPILPGARLSLCLTSQPLTGRVRYQYRDALYAYATGTLDFGIAP